MPEGTLTQSIPFDRLTFMTDGIHTIPTNLLAPRITEVAEWLRPDIIGSPIDRMPFTIVTDRARRGKTTWVAQTLKDSLCLIAEHSGKDQPEPEPSSD